MQGETKGVRLDAPAERSSPTASDSGGWMRYWLLWRGAKKRLELTTLRGAKVSLEMDDDGTEAQFFGKLMMMADGMDWTKRCRRLAPVSVAAVPLRFSASGRLLQPLGALPSER